MKATSNTSPRFPESSISQTRVRLPRRRGWWQALGWLGLLQGLHLGLPWQAIGQPILHVPDSTACSTCSIALSKFVRLGGPDDPVSPGHYPSVVRTTHDEFVLGPTVGGDELAVFGNDGRFIKTIGRQGEGPGEFLEIDQLLVHDNRLIVGDRGTLRLTFFGLPLEPSQVTTLPIPWMPDGLAVTDAGNIILHAQIPTPEAAGLPLHVLDEHGSIERSFGALNPEVRPDRPAAGYRRIAPSADGFVWSARRDRYEIERWDESGRLQRTLVRQVPWFVVRNGEGSSGSADERRPQATIKAIHEDGQGRLWVLILVADANWRATASPSAPGKERTSLTPAGERTRLYDAVIEVIDPARGELIASTHHDESHIDNYLMGFVEAGLLTEYVQEPDGYDYVDLWRVRLIQR